MNWCAAAVVTLVVAAGGRRLLEAPSWAEALLTWLDPQGNGAMAAGAALLRPFRFMTTAPPLRGGSMAQWRDEVRRIEDLGFDTVTISDHLGAGWSMDPIVTMTVAAEATTRLRVASTMLCNDFRHPALIHRAMANLDVYSGGRVELGLGAGWRQSDYLAAGLPFDPPAVRLDRLEESLAIVTALFQQERVDFAGKHYVINGLEGLPRPVQRPHPPLIVGGGGPRILRLAGRTATIASIHAAMPADRDPTEAIADHTPDQLRRKITWVRQAAVAAGRDPDAIELQFSLLRIRVTAGGATHEWRSSQAAPSADGAPTLAALEGSVAECVESLQRLRAEYGVSYLHLGNNLEAAAPIVAALAGT